MGAADQSLEKVFPFRPGMQSLGTPRISFHGRLGPLEQLVGHKGFVGAFQYLVPVPDLTGVEGLCRIPLTDAVLNSLGPAASPPLLLGSRCMFLVRKPCWFIQPASWLRVVVPVAQRENRSPTASAS